MVSHLPDANGAVRVARRLVETDEGPRPDSSAESLAKLRPVFAARGSVTAGNSSQMSDGAAAVILVSDRILREFNLQPLARFVSFAVAGVPPGGHGHRAGGPKVLERGGITQDALDWIELNEAFAAQSLAVMRELRLDPAKVNPLGGAIALGHPLGATGDPHGHAGPWPAPHRRQARAGDDVHRHRHGRGWPVRGAVGRRVSSEALLVQAPVPEWRARLMRVGFNLHPAFRATGGRVLHVSPDFHHIRIAAAVAAHPQYRWLDVWRLAVRGDRRRPPTMLMSALGSDHIVWDKAASIRYRKPLYTTLYVDFRLPAGEIAEIPRDPGARA